MGCAPQVFTPSPYTPSTSHAPQVRLHTPPPLPAPSLLQGSAGENMKPILRNVTGSAQPGCLLAVMGASGCGKTVHLPPRALLLPHKSSMLDHVEGLCRMWCTLTLWCFTLWYFTLWYFTLWYFTLWYSSMGVLSARLSVPSLSPCGPAPTCVPH